MPRTSHARVSEVTSSSRMVVETQKPDRSSLELLRSESLTIEEPVGIEEMSSGQRTSEVRHDVWVPGNCFGSDAGVEPAQLTQSCCIAHRAAAARVDTPIFV